jgi:hypothetical protein
MASTVISAFDEFIKNTVNLDSTKTKTARGSRDWLINQIHSFPTLGNNFPDLYSEMDIHFGSFARRTKIRPLDDIDIMVCLHGRRSTYYQYSDRIAIHVPEEAITLKGLCFEGSNVLNSKKLINRVITYLSTVPQYERADIKRNLEAATLKLVSYDWNFDIVPCFITTIDSFTNRNYYLIPDGNGNWKKTDPRKDRDLVSNVNQYHDGNVLNLIRIIKYWNKRPTMPSMGSYLLEALLINYYNWNTSPKAGKYVDLEVLRILPHLASAILSQVNDPKEIQGDINTLSFEDRLKISIRATADYRKAVDARRLEEASKHRESIEKWTEIFGGAFPKYS